jgi:class 3 adenylate cyclase
LRYAQAGPSPLDLVVVAHQPGRAERVVRDWQRWRAAHYGDWAAGRDAPSPPHYTGARGCGAGMVGASWGRRAHRPRARDRHGLLAEYATFDGPARAIHCAHQVRDRVRDLGIETRAGIHTGECEVIDGKHGGIAVTTGARISALAQPSQVLVSQTVKDLVAGSGFNFEPAGEHELKGVPDRWRVYSVT